MSKARLFKRTAAVVAMALCGALALSGCGKEECCQQAEAPSTNATEKSENVLTNLSAGRLASMQDPVYQAKLVERLDGRRELQKELAKANAQLEQARQAEQPDAELIARLEAEQKAVMAKFAAYERKSRAIVYQQVQKDLQTGTNFQQNQGN